MKQMNLIPNEVKQKRKINEYKKIGAYVSLLPIAVMAQSYLSLSFMKGDIQELNDNITAAKNLQQQIQEEEKLIEKNRSIIINLTSGGLPLNQFLLFTGVNLPEDIRLYSITSETAYDQAAKEKEKEENAAAEGTVQEISTTEPATDENGQPIEEGTEEKTEELIIEEKKNNIIIKGAALNVDSIGTFMSNLENKNEYIANVDISDVQNFYNGAFNYKLFEIVVELNN